jgi:multidrug efflux pump subunit AcrB
LLALVRIALTRPLTFVVLALFIVIFGALAALRTPTDIFPTIGIPVVAVVWTYNGLPAEGMADYVIYYYERSLTSSVNDIQHIESQSFNGYGVVKIYFQPGVNINGAVAQITAMSQSVLKYLPPGITPPQVLTFNASSVPVLALALSSKTVSQEHLFDEAQNFIRPQLATVAGAAVPSPYGGKVRQIQVDINQQQLQAHGLSAADVVNAMTQENLILPIGTEKVGKFEYTVSLNDAPAEIAELNDLPIKRVNGTVIYVHDVALVHDGYPPQINIVNVDGSRAVLLTIQTAGSASTLDVINGVRRLLPQIRAGLPDGVTLTAVDDQSVYVTSAVVGVLREAAIAAALTALMILLFLGSWRSTLIIAVSIPLAVLSSIVALAAIGQTINVMTLGGLALAVGILVDEATVTIENINFHLEAGKDIDTAIMDGAAQIVVPAFLSMLCICIVFVPMFSLGGVAGYLFVPLAEAVVFAMVASFLLSRTLVLTMAHKLLAHQGHQGHHGGSPPPTRNPLVRLQRGFEHGFEAVRARYVALLAGVLARPLRFISIFMVVVLASFGLAPFLGENFFPDVDGGQIRMHVRAQIGTRIEESARLMGYIDQAVRDIIPAAQIDSIVDNIGMTVSGINTAYNNSGTIGPEDADILVTLTPSHDPTAGFVDRLRVELPRRFPGSSFAFLPADITTQILNFGAPAPIDVQIAGRDAAANRAYANALLRKLQLVTGIADARIQQSFAEPNLQVDVDRTLANETGLTERDVTTALQTTLAGSIQTAPMFWLNHHNGVAYPLVVQMPQYGIDTVGELANVPIVAAGRTQLLGAIAGIHQTNIPAAVSHYNVQPVIDIFATTRGRDLGAVTADVQTIIDTDAHHRPHGAQVVLRGQASTMKAAYTQLLVGLGFAIVLVYLVIVVNFQSWADPFIIITALPAALAGIVWMLFLTFTTLSVPALTGAIMCMGVATANSILMVSFAREQLAEGKTAIAAALAAGAGRFRPVLMTALAMVIGMIPMAVSADQNAPLGRAVIGGLICATVATLIFVPTVFSVIHRRSHLIARADDRRHVPAHP